MSAPMRACLLLALSLALTAVGCAGPEEPAASQIRYELRGEVVATDEPRGTVTVDHEAVADYMTAMTMPFNVRDRWVFEAAEPGARISAILVIEGESSWLEEVVINKASTAGEAMRAVVPSADVGAPVPDIDLVDQDGESISVSDYRGRPLLFTFIYTRCPLPDFCPRMSLNFERVFRGVEANPGQFGDVQLLSISVDPAYDTPEVLREYGVKYLEDQAPAGFERWRFATTDAPQLKTIAEFTGLRFMPESGEIIHSLRTVIVDAEGRVAKVYVGNTWQPELLLDDLEALSADGRESG